MTVAADSPFHPGFGQPPAYLAGRDAVVEAGAQLVERAAVPGLMPSPLILVGPRGVGKTVLLREIAVPAGEVRGWPRVRLEVVTDASFTPQIAAKVAEALASLPEHQRQGLQLDELVAKAGVGPVGAEAHFRRREPGGVEAANDLELLLRPLAEALEEIGSGVVITVDEAHNMAPRDLNALAAALQAGTEFGWPFAVVFAGLASLRNVTAGVTYLERGDWREVGFLDERAAIAALVRPAELAQKPMEPAAAQYLAERSGGYPYAIQLFGDRAWSSAASADRITLAHARAGSALAEQALAAGLYANRWSQAPARERQYLLATAEELRDSGTATGASVAKRLGGTTPKWSTHRARLINKGTIFANGGGALHFAIPGMQQYVLAHADEVAPR